MYAVVVVAVVVAVGGGGVEVVEEVAVVIVVVVVRIFVQKREKGMSGYRYACRKERKKERTYYLVQEVHHFTARKIRRDGQTGGGPETVFVAVHRQGLTDVRSSNVVPH